MTGPETSGGPQQGTGDWGGLNGADVTPALPYLVLGFAFQSDFLKN